MTLVPGGGPFSKHSYLPPSYSIATLSLASSFSYSSSIRSLSRQADYILVHVPPRLQLQSPLTAWLDIGDVTITKGSITYGFPDSERKYRRWERP